MKKSLLFIGLSYHTKTKSSQFLQEMLKKEYDLELLNFDPHPDDIYAYLKILKRQKYDVLLIWQAIPHMETILKYISFEKGVLFPMYDSAMKFPDANFLQYKDFNIINFSKTMHERTLRLGLSSYYIQYFPKPAAKFEPGDEKSIFFWQRATRLNIQTVEQLFSNININHIHLHKALDPSCRFLKPSKKLSGIISYSSWYNEKDDMLEDIKESAYYIAPRKYEGIGMSFLEAMALGKCVVSPNNPTMNEYITHGKTGILYEIDDLKPIKQYDVAEIQKNTYEYMKIGYEKWEKEKKNILDWIVATPVINVDLYNKASKKNKYLVLSKHYFFSFILLYSVNSMSSNSKVYRLFNKIDFLKITKSPRKTRFFLFGIPIWKIRR